MCSARARAAAGGASLDEDLERSGQRNRCGSCWALHISGRGGGRRGGRGDGRGDGGTGGGKGGGSGDVRSGGLRGGLKSRQQQQHGLQPPPIPHRTPR